ncbi:hypothetical protein NDU88_004683 [Pleurodeles waltl]|uniref:Uncharacterized protein n=1 Tax=Pleurodeles waltl TaxID=8319 RepID=A0AAV7LM64_PLEWA|nr:hypothetical protein NDU88_004683 [Pleurodeles waltl]
MTIFQRLLWNGYRGQQHNDDFCLIFDLRARGLRCLDTESRVCREDTTPSSGKGMQRASERDTRRQESGVALVPLAPLAQIQAMRKVPMP